MHRHNQFAAFARHHVHLCRIGHQAAHHFAYAGHIVAAKVGKHIAVRGVKQAVDGVALLLVERRISLGWGIFFHAYLFYHGQRCCQRRLLVEIFYSRRQAASPVGIALCHAGHVEIIKNRQQIFNLHRIKPARTLCAEAVDGRAQGVCQHGRQRFISRQAAGFFQSGKPIGFIARALRTGRLKSIFIRQRA